jgi:hypothetical protein
VIVDAVRKPSLVVRVGAGRSCCCIYLLYRCLALMFKCQLIVVRPGGTVARRN